MHTYVYALVNASQFFIHAYTEAYIHTQRHTCIHRGIHAYSGIHAYTEAYMHTQRHTCIHRGIHAYTEAYIHTQRHTCIHRGRDVRCAYSYTAGDAITAPGCKGPQTNHTTASMHSSNTKRTGVTPTNLVSKVGFGYFLKENLNWI